MIYVRKDYELPLGHSCRTTHSARSTQSHCPGFPRSVFSIKPQPKGKRRLIETLAQTILRDAGETKAENLDKQIGEVLPKLPAYIAKDVDAIRHCGNFCGYPIKSQTLVKLLMWNLRGGMEHRGTASVVRFLLCAAEVGRGAPRKVQGQGRGCWQDDEVTIATDGCVYSNGTCYSREQTEVCIKTTRVSVLEAIDVSSSNRCVNSDYSSYPDIFYPRILARLRGQWAVCR